MNGDRSLAMRPSLMVMRTTSYLLASLFLLLLLVQRSRSKGSVQEGRSCAPKSLHDIATRVHLALASFDRLSLEKNSGTSTSSSCRLIHPFRGGNFSASAAGMIVSLESIGLLSVIVSSLNAQKYPRACSKNTRFSAPVLGWFLMTYFPGSMCRPCPSGCIRIFLFRRDIDARYSSPHDDRSLDDDDEKLRDVVGSVVGGVDCQGVVRCCRVSVVS
mmetsp:Transcript_30488/g.73575  ORF Transcript_30488/g.73575 Transcript_30488/m.73575 type:complete len:216 (+) Transcript_30488:328-975(+)